MNICKTKALCLIWVIATAVGPVLADSPRPNPGWLGLQLTPVPTALARHLQLMDAGVMVTNIIVGSPADAAGLQRYDVIIEAGGQKVGGNVQAFSRFVQERKSGQDLELTLYREGKPLQVSVRLGELPGDRHQQSLKYEQDPDVIAQRGFNLRGKILRPRAGGGYDVEDLGEIPNIREWPDFVPNLPPGEGPVTDGRRVDEFGNVLHVRRLPDGRIEVKRYQRGQDPSLVPANTYANMDALRDADREAAKLLESAHQRQRSKGYDEAVEEYLNRFNFPDSDDAHDWREWAERFSRRMENLQRRPRDRDIDRQARPFQPEAAPPSPETATPAPQPDTQPAQPPAPEVAPPPMPTTQPPHPAAPVEPPPELMHARPLPPPATTRFEVMTDGEIRVNIRQGDSEITRSFRSSEQMREQAPRLHRKFQQFQREWQ